MFEIKLLISIIHILYIYMYMYIIYIHVYVCEMLMNNALFILLRIYWNECNAVCKTNFSGDIFRSISYIIFILHPNKKYSFKCVHLFVHKINQKVFIYSIQILFYTSFYRSQANLSISLNPLMFLGPNMGPNQFCQNFFFFQIFSFFLKI